MTFNNNIASKQGGGCLRTLGIMFITIIISVATTVFILDYYLFPKKFDPVALNSNEESILNQKLKQFGLPSFSQTTSSKNSLEPEPYSETGAEREISFTEKELNAMLAKNTDLANKVAIDLSENLASIRVIIPLDPDLPFLGGKTLKANAGATFAYAEGKPIIAIKGISIWGVPLPNAWIGNIKNIDLIKEYGGNDGFWRSFSDGVENIQVSEGRLIIKLKE